MKTRKTILMTILAMTFILSSNLTKAQLPIDPETKKVTFTSVVEFPGVTKDILYKKAKLWIVSTLKSGDNMVELNGSNSDQIIGVGNLVLDSLIIYKKEFATNCYLNFKFIVFCKENKIKYSVENFSLHYDFLRMVGGYKNQTHIDSGLEAIKAPEDYLTSEKQVAEFRLKNQPYIKSVIENLINSFLSSMKKEQNDNW